MSTGTLMTVRLPGVNRCLQDDVSELSSGGSAGGSKAKTHIPNVVLDRKDLSKTTIQNKLPCFTVQPDRRAVGGFYWEKLRTCLLSVIRV